MQNNQLFPTGVPEDASSSPQLMKDRWLSIFVQLGTSERFVEFINKNYAIIDRVNHEEKTVDTLVVENPISYGPPLTIEQITAIRKAVGKRKDGNKVTEQILKILGNEDVPQIEVVSSLV